MSKIAMVMVAAWDSMLEVGHYYLIAFLVYVVCVFSLDEILGSSTIAGVISIAIYLRLQGYAIEAAEHRRWELYAKPID